MADIDVVQKPAGQTWPWILLAVLCVGGLMGWLAYHSERATTTPLVQEEAADGAPAGTAEQVPLETLGADPDTYVGRDVLVPEVAVAAVLGPRAFWGDIPGANPFLVVIDPQAREAPRPADGQRLQVRGTVQPVTDQVLDEWVRTEAITAARRDEAGFATHYLHAVAARP